MNLVDGAMTFPVPVGNDVSLARSEDTTRHMEAVGWGDLAAVLVRNLAIIRGLHVVDTLLLVIGHYFCSYFSSIFNPTSLHIPYPTFPPYGHLCYVPFSMSFMLTNRQQEYNSIGTTGH